MSAEDTFKQAITFLQARLSKDCPNASLSASGLNHVITAQIGNHSVVFYSPDKPQYSMDYHHNLKALKG